MSEEKKKRGRKKGQLFPSGYRKKSKIESDEVKSPVIEAEITA